MISYDARGHGESPPAPDPPPTSTATWWPTCATCSTSSAWTARCWPAARWAPPPRWRSRWRSPSACPRSCRSRRPTTARPRTDPADLEEWEALAARDGRARTSTVFVELSGVNRLPEQFRDVARRAVRQRLERHRAPAGGGRRPARGAPLHRLRRAGRTGRPRPARTRGGQPRRDRPRPPARAWREEYARRLPRAKLVVEDEGESPLAWRGAQLSREIAEFLECRLPVATRTARRRSARSSRPPAPPPRSPGWCPSTAVTARARPPAPPGARSAGGCPRRRSANGGMVIRPPTGTGQRSRKSPSSAGAIPPLPSSPATFTWMSTSRAGWLASCLSAESEASEWIRRTRAPRPSPCGSAARR